VSMVSLRLITLSLLVALAYSIEFKFDYAVGLQLNSSVVGRILVKTSAADSWKKVCGAVLLADSNLETICRFNSWDNYTQITEDPDTPYEWSEQITTVGFKTVDCAGKAKKASCVAAEIGSEGCTRDLIIKCGAKWTFDSIASGSNLILPIVLVVASFFVLFLMIIKDYFEKKEKMKMFIQRNASKERFVMGEVTKALATSPALFRKNDVAPNHEENNNHGNHTEEKTPTVRITSAESQVSEKSSRYVV